MRFRFDWKNFLVGFGACMLAFILPIISEPFINITTSIRDKIGGK